MQNLEHPRTCSLNHVPDNEFDGQLPWTDRFPGFFTTNRWGDLPPKVNGAREHGWNLRPAIIEKYASY